MADNDNTGDGEKGELSDADIDKALEKVSGLLESGKLSGISDLLSGGQAVNDIMLYMNLEQHQILLALAKKAGATRADLIGAELEKEIGTFEEGYAKIEAWYHAQKKE